MTDAELLETCIQIAVKAHRMQRDKSGHAYILHPLRVMAGVRAGRGTVAQQAAAVLHDVIEDTPVTFADLEQAGIPADVRELVDALTHRDDEPTEDYLQRVLGLPAAVLVKLTDVLDNAGRVVEIEDEATRERLAQKYARALTVLRRES
jgi:(p)ppGpp synthase/HD superfamily hydrolase